MAENKLIIRLYGAFDCSDENGKNYRLSGQKHRALLAMLATAPNGTQTRSWIQDVLWGRSEIKNRRESMRRALTDFRTIFGDAFERYFKVTNLDVQLRPELFEVAGTEADGAFLQGIHIPGQGGFDEWLAQKRDPKGGNPSVVEQDFAHRICPTVSVIPFLTFTESSQSAHLSDLITLEVTRALTGSSFINVISHLSSRRFAGKLLELSRVKTALQVDYLVTGTLHIDGDEFHLVADFINASSGQNYWSRRYNGRISDILSGRTENAREVAHQVGFSILKSSIELSRSRPLPQVESHALFMAAINDIHRHRLANFSNARRQLEHLVERVPDHSVLYAWLAKWYVLAISQGWSDSAAVDTRLALDHIQRALDIDPACAVSLTVDGMIRSSSPAEQSLADKRFQEALAIDPNHALAWLMYARMYAYRGDGGKAVEYAQRATFLSPLDPHGYFFDALLAMCHVVDGNLQRGYDLISRSLSANPNHVSTHRAKVITLQMMGRDAEANAAAKHLLRRDPTLTVENYIESHPAGDSAIGQDWGAALKAAGIPQHSIR